MSLDKTRARRVAGFIIGGFLATCLITVVVQPVARFLNFPEFDFARSLMQGFTDRPVETFSLTWWGGLALHFFSGTVLFPLLYSAFQARFFPRDNVIGSGVGFGVGLWFLTQLVLFPLAGVGFFGRLTQDPALLGFVGFNAHVLYGLVLGFTAAYLEPVQQAKVIYLERKAA